jgi:hypothetical protein
MYQEIIKIRELQGDYAAEQLANRFMEYIRMNGPQNTDFNLLIQNLQNFATNKSQIDNLKAQIQQGNLESNVVVQIEKKIQSLTAGNNEIVGNITGNSQLLETSHNSLIISKSTILDEINKLRSNNDKNNLVEPLMNIFYDFNN